MRLFGIIFTGGLLLFASSSQAAEADGQEEMNAAAATRSAYLSTKSLATSNDVPKVDLEVFRAKIAPILVGSCVKCHGPETAEGDFRVDTLDPDLLHGEDVSWWLEVRNALSNGEMPPADEGVELTDIDRRKVIDWLSSLKAKEWLSIPRPTVHVGHLNLEITPEDPRNYLKAMFELIFLAFQTDSTRTVTYQLGRENGIGVSDRLARAVGFELTHMLSHNVKKPGGWENFGKYHRYLREEWGLFLTRLKSTPEPGGHGSMLDNTLCLFGSVSSAFHLSRNYPLILAGGQRMGIRQGQYLQYGSFDLDTISGSASDSIRRVKTEEDPMGRLLVTMLRQLGIDQTEFAGCNQVLTEVLA